jgi:PleD family two-component response regulator
MPTILFADDEPSVREVVADFLEHHGHHVQLARNGREALELVSRSTPDLVVLDYSMGTPDGFEVCRDLKNSPRFGHLPVLILTGQSALESRLAGFEAGADDFLSKPFDLRELLARVSALLRLANRGLQRNPTSGLAGGQAIQEELARRQRRGEVFALCYLDLDDFKPFGECFGFAVADEVIRSMGQVLHEVGGDPDVFVGHIGGDDFLLLCRPDQARHLSLEVQHRIRQRILQMLPPEVVRRGRYQAEARDGAIAEFPITHLSAAILRIPAGTTLHLAELGPVVSRIKRQAKLTEARLLEVELPG